MVRLPRSAGGVSASGWFAGLCGFVAGVAALSTRVLLQLPAHTDSARDLLLARVCQDDVCPMLGAPTSMEGIFQGGWWTLHLALLEMLGMEPDGIFTLGLLSNIAAMALLAWGLYRVSGAWGAALGLVVAVVGNLWMESYWTQLWNPLLTPFFCTGFALALISAVRSGAVVPAVAAMSMLVMAVQTHPAALVLLVPWSMVVAVRFERKSMLISVVLGLALLLMGTWAFSKDSLHLGMLAAAERGYGMSVVIPSLLGAGWLWATLLMALRFYSRRGGARVLTCTWWPLYAGTLLALLLPLGGWALGLHALLQDRYVGPLLPLVAVSLGIGFGGVAVRVSKFERPLPVAARTFVPWVLAFIPLLLIPLLPQRPRMPHDWTYSQAKVAAELLADDGLLTSYQAALRAIRAPNRGGLLLGLTRHLPSEVAVESPKGLNLGVSQQPFCGAAEHSGLLAVREVPQGWLCGHHFSPALDWGRVWMRWEPQESGGWHPFTFWPETLSQPVPSPVALSDVPLPGRTSWVEAWVPVMLPPGQTIRLVTAGNCGTDARVTVVAAEGIESHFVSSTEVVLTSQADGDEEQTGWLLVRFQAVAGSMLADHQIQPAIWEGLASDPAFDTFVDAVRCPVGDVTQVASSASEDPTQRAFLAANQGPSPWDSSSANQAPAHWDFPKPPEAAITSACSTSFGVACLQRHSLSPVRFPFTVAVFLYLISLLATGWAWGVTLRVLWHSESTEMR